MTDDAGCADSGLSTDPAGKHVTQSASANRSFGQRSAELTQRIEHILAETLGGNDRLCQAMRYSVVNGGKRLRPLLVYASGELLNIKPDLLDSAACAVEFIHCYSLVHDDLPAMDDDALRRGRPTTHLQFDEATAILAGDALQALAFEVLSSDPGLHQHPSAGMAMIATLTRACGASGMAGGQALDLQLEGHRPSQDALETMFRLKTGALIRASVMMPAALAGHLDQASRQALARFAEQVGLAFQICDDLLDIEGETAVIGKTVGSDVAHDKATWPGLFGIDAARRRIAELSADALSCLARLEGNADGLLWLTDRLLNRDR